MLIDADGVAIRGNQFVPVQTGTISFGVEMVDSPGRVTFETNEVIGWRTGIVMRGANKVVRRNVVTQSITGIIASPGSVVQGNVVIGTDEGILLPTGVATITGNAFLGNDEGITNSTGGPGTVFTGTLAKNNIYGNIFCGIDNHGTPGLIATENYWGAPTGPGSNPADNVCNSTGGTTTTDPFATKPFNVKPALKP